MTPFSAPPLSLLYSAFSYFCGSKVESGEYKLMGLAPNGAPRYADVIRDKLLDLEEDASFRLDLGFFNCRQGMTMTSSWFDELFGGPPRPPEDSLTEREMDLAASIQKVVEEIMLRAVRHLHRETGMTNLCLAGGVALNFLGNGRIFREGPFEHIWIQPAAGDAGVALGVALLTWLQLLGNRDDLQAPPDASAARRWGRGFRPTRSAGFSTPPAPSTGGPKTTTASTTRSSPSSKRRTWSGCSRAGSSLARGRSAAARSAAMRAAARCCR